MNATVQEPKSVTIYGNEIKPQVGSYILVGEQSIGSRLKPGTDFSDSGFPGCQFYYPTNSRGPIRELACNITITGRTLQRRPYEGHNLFVKIRIEWVGDCEPSTFCEGWMLVN